MATAGTAATAGVVTAAFVGQTAEVAPQSGRERSVRDFGAVGDGATDDTAALQAALDATFAGGDAGILVMPPGAYKVTRTLRVAPPAGPEGNSARRSGIVARGARLQSAISDGTNVLEFVSRSTIRFVLLEGLDILGSGREGHGIHIACEHNDAYFYNFCLRDVVVQGCGGDGCHLIGNVFEGQILNSYFRKNHGNGATFAHGLHAGILSAIHVFGCVFGDNGEQGAALVNRCYDVAFHGCYFLLNGKSGLAAMNGCTLLSNCGFENNHQAATGFAAGQAGIDLRSFGTLVGCTGYSVFKQSQLIQGFVATRLVMVGCTGSGDGQAKGAGLAQLGGSPTASATLVGCNGATDYVDGFEALEVGDHDGGIRFGSDWQSRNLPRFGDYRLWIDRRGRLRLKRGQPSSDEDGSPVGVGA